MANTIATSAVERWEEETGSDEQNNMARNDRRFVENINNIIIYLFSV